MQRKLPTGPDSLQNPEAFQDEAAGDRPNTDQVEGEHFSVGGLRHMPRGNFPPLPPDPHAGGDDSEHRQPDSRFNEDAIAGDNARRGGR